MKRIRTALLALTVLSTLVAVPVVRAAPPSPPSPSKPEAEKAIFFAADGMRPDLMEGFADDGVMPTFADLMTEGMVGENGLLQGFPPNTGVGWYTLATGTWPGEHGSTNNTFHRTGESNFNNRTSFAAPGILQADTLLQAAERAGKTVVSVEWVGARGLVPALQGPVVDFRSFFSDRGILLNFDLPGQPALASSFGVTYQRVGDADETGIDALDRASGWRDVPMSFTRARQTQLKLTNTAFPSTNNVDRFYDLYIYDSTDDRTTNYDHVLVVPSTARKDGDAAVADLSEGAWADVKVELTGGRAGQTGGFYLKAIDIEADLSALRIYFTSITRANASFNGCTYATGCATPLGFEETLNARFPSSTAADFAPLEAGIVDEDTYVEQGLMWADAHHRYLSFIIEDGAVDTGRGDTIEGLGVEPDLLFAGTPITDEFSHQFMALVTETDIDGDPNPFFDDVEADGVPDGRVAAREGYIEAAYEEADATLGLARELMGEDTTVLATSDHGFAPQWYAVNGRRVLWETMVEGDAGAVRVHASGENATSNCGASGTDLAKACWAGGAIQVYVNPTLPEGVTYEEVREAVVDAFTVLEDPGNLGEQVVDAVLLKEELRDVQGTDALHPNRSGDVVIALRPPYQSDAGTAGVAIAPSRFFGQHGYLPDLVDLAHNVNMHGTFVAAGPGIGQGVIDGVRAIDLAPTLAFLMGFPGPQNARGQILYEALDGASHLREVTILDISDYHGQLTPLSERSDSFGPSFSIGGAAFLSTWFDVYRGESQGPVLTVAGGDSVGATPPISSFFGDTPTIDAMNLMGFDVDGLGNHNFDRGEEFLRETLIPLADFEYVSANIVDENSGRTPQEWSPSETFDFGDFELAVVGFSNPDIPELTKPGSLGPFVVTDPLEAVNDEAVRLRRMRSMAAVVALGHLGATAGTLDAPTGPLIDLADGVEQVDVVIGDHTNLQVLDVRPNGVLVVENLSKGVRFSRVRIVVDANADAVVYSTADFHKPWTIGVEADPEIQAMIDELNAELAPILGAEVGASTVEVPRADSCGRSDGRLCESLIGNAVTDAMRTTYGVDFAITNAGGLRADLTCPVTDDPDDFCPAFTPPPYPITRGQVLTVLPFGNVVSTVTISGTELEAFLENGVSAMPAANGRFPQVSGLCFMYEITSSAGSRVTNVVRANPDGSCSATPVGLGAGDSYTLAINDFMASGGDGYPNVASRATTRDVMDEVVAGYIEANTPISPAIQGRIVCTDANGAGTAPDCPLIVAP